MDVGVKVTGAKELRAKIKQAEDTDLKGELKQAYRDTATLIVTAARQRAPEQSGDLKASIRPLGGVTSAVVAAGNARVPYAAPIHWGWPKRGITAQPFIGEALKDEWDRVADTFEAAVDRVTDQINN